MSGRAERWFARARGSQAARRTERRFASAFVRRVAGASDEQLEALDGARGRAIVAGVFRLMPLQVDRRAASRTTGTVEWRVTEADGGASIHTLLIGGGRCRVRRGVVSDPDLVIELSTADFLKLVAGVENGPALFGSGRIKLRGDTALALRLPLLFRVPRADPPRGA